MATPPSLLSRIPLKLIVSLLFVLIFLLLVVRLWRQVFGPGDNSASQVVVVHNTVLKEITEMGRLELVKYNFKDVVEYERGATDYETLNQVFGKAKAILIVSGEAVGCLDLQKVKPTDVVEVGQDSVVIYLPEPELCYYKIDHTQSRVYAIENGLMVEKGKMVSDAYAKAETQIRQAALDMGILDQTRANANKILQPFLERAAGRRVTLRYRLTSTNKR